MTVIFRGRLKKGCFYLADILTSAEGFSRRSVPMPGTTNINSRLPLSAKRHYRGGFQKIWIPQPDMIFSFAGQLAEAKDILPRLRSQIVSGKHTSENATELVRGRSKSLQVVGSFCTDAGVNHFAARSRTYDRQALIGDILGSGTNQLVDVLESRDGEIDETVDPVSFATAVAGQLLAGERKYGANLKDWYGGGYEIAYISGREFKKLDGVYHEIGEIVLDGQGKRFLRWGPPEIYLYIRGYLCIATPSKTAMHFHVVPPLIPNHAAPPTADDLPNEIRCETICSHVVDRTMPAPQSAHVHFLSGEGVFAVLSYDDKGMTIHQSEKIRDNHIRLLDPDGVGKIVLTGKPGGSTPFTVLGRRLISSQPEPH